MKSNELWQFDQNFCKTHRIHDLIGIDEAGRGALAGPVMVAAVRLPVHFSHPEINDSKQIRESKREILFDWILAQPGVEAQIVSVSPKVIDQINILQATLTAMQIAGKQLQKEQSFFLIDGDKRPDELRPAQALVKGDARSLAIATASILAKVARDRVMRYWHHHFPDYNFFQNKGYGSREHREMLQKKGSVVIHRNSFLRKILNDDRQLSLFS